MLNSESPQGVPLGAFCRGVVARCGGYLPGRLVGFRLLEARAFAGFLVELRLDRLLVGFFVMGMCRVPDVNRGIAANEC